MTGLECHIWALCQLADVEFKAQCSGRATKLSGSGFPVETRIPRGSALGQNQSLLRLSRVNRSADLLSANRSYDNAGGYPGGGYPRCPGGGYPGGGRTRTGRNGSGATTQVHWNAQRNN